MEKEKKALFVATVVKTHINVFHLPYLKMLKEMGYRTYVAAKNDFENEPCVIPYCDCYYDIPFAREPLDKNNLSAYKMLVKIINEESFDIIHCHTPVGGVLARLAARRSRKKGTKVIYTAHGFHFYKGAPLKNWLLYYPAERLCSYFTDVLITINKEDYVLAQRKMKAKKIYYVPGVGIDLQKFSDVSVNKEEKRKELGVPDNAVLLLSVGELNENKNHETVIRSLAAISDPKIFYIIAGRGSKKQQLENVISELGLRDNVRLIGYRSDVNELLAAADIFVFPSHREGLPVALMEAMACGLPIACSRIRGNTDLIDGEKGGVTFDPQSTESTANALKKLLKSDYKAMGLYNGEKINSYGLEKVKNEMKKIYEELN